MSIKRRYMQHWIICYCIPMAFSSVYSSSLRNSTMTWMKWLLNIVKTHVLNETKTMNLIPLTSLADFSDFVLLFFLWSIASRFIVLLCAHFHCVESASDLQICCKNWQRKFSLFHFMAMRWSYQCFTFLWCLGVRSKLMTVWKRK